MSEQVTSSDVKLYSGVSLHTVYIQYIWLNWRTDVQTNTHTCARARHQSFTITRSVSQMCVGLAIRACKVVFLPHCHSSPSTAWHRGASKLSYTDWSKENNHDDHNIFSSIVRVCVFAQASTRYLTSLSLIEVRFEKIHTISKPWCINIMNLMSTTQLFNSVRTK